MPAFLGIGNAALDITAHVGDDFLKKNNLHLNQVYSLGYRSMQNLLDKLPAPVYIPGGGTFNTLCHLSSLGLETAFYSVIGQDKGGQIFRNALTQYRIRDLTLSTSLATGICLYLISPQKTVAVTHMKAARRIKIKQSLTAALNHYRYLYCEGYLLHSPKFLEDILQLANRNGLTICFDLSHHLIVTKQNRLIRKMAEKYVDILFLNEDEAKSFLNLPRNSDLPENDQLEKINQLCDLVVIKLGEKGCLLLKEGEKNMISPFVPRQIKNTIGAGDAFAAGFLYGYSHYFNLKQCAGLGNRLGAKVVEVTGTKLSQPEYQAILERL